MKTYSMICVTCLIKQVMYKGHYMEIEPKPLALKIDADGLQNEHSRLRTWNCSCFDQPQKKLPSIYFDQSIMLIFKES